MYEFRIAEVTAQLLSLGVESGDLLLVHSSFRAIRPVEGGPLGVIAALREALGSEGTLVMPTMTDGEGVFDPRSTPTSEMGILPELFFRQPGVVRSTHPGASFAAFGPLADRICAPHPLSPPHGVESPAGRVYQLDGKVLLAGVTQGESTTLHVAESIVRVPYSVEHPCVVVIDGKPERLALAETDHCCRGFHRVDVWLAARGLVRPGQVGHAPASLARARDVVAVALAHLAEDPCIFLCAEGSGCVECDLAWASTRPGNRPGGASVAASGPGVS